MENKDFTVKAAALAITAIAVCLNLAPDKINRIPTLLLTANPFTAVLAGVAVSTIIQAIRQRGYALRNSSTTSDTTLIDPEKIRQKKDVLIVNSRNTAEGFAIFELKGTHIDALQQPNTALATALHRRNISGSIDIIIDGNNDPRILYCIKTKGRRRNQEALVRETDEKAEAFQSIFETVYEGLVNLERIKGPSLTQHMTLAHGCGNVCRVEQEEEGPLPQPHLEKLLKNTHKTRAWISVVYEPWKTEGTSLDTITLRLKQSGIKREHQAAVKKSGVRVTDPDPVQQRSVNTLNADIGKMLQARTLQASYEMLERGRRTGLWKIQIRVAVPDEETNPTTQTSTMRMISALHASLLTQDPTDTGQERQVNVVEANDTARELRDMILRRIDRKPLIATSSDLAHFLKPQPTGNIYLTPNTPTPSPATLTQRQQSIILGRVLTASEKPALQFGLTLESLRKHTVILGATGSGKSTTARIIAHELSQRKIPTLILDWTGEFRLTLPRTTRNTAILTPGKNLTLNLFETNNPGQDTVEWVDTLDYYAQTNWGTPLTPLQRRILMETLDNTAKKTEPVTFTRVLRDLKNLEKQVAHRRDWTQSIEALISRIQPPTLGRNRQVFDQPKTTLDPEKIFQPATTIVDLSTLWGDEAKTLLSQLLCKKIYDHTRRNPPHTDDTRLILIIDEAQHIAPQLTKIDTTANLGIIERYALELRKHGIGLITIASRPALLSKNIIANANTLICHKLIWQEDVNRVAETLGLIDPHTWRHDEAYKQCLRTLPPGQAIVKIDHHAAKFAFQVKIGLKKHTSLIHIIHPHRTPDSGPIQKTLIVTPIPKMSTILEVAVLRLYKNVAMSRKELRLSRRQARQLITLELAERDIYDNLTITERGREVAEAMINQG